ncbi:Rieske (2Fe-2S) protein [Paenibacillus radicis (ex Xue et al. 2023)]|uniref:Rieske (2Fe-2S) protein n=1 Tax=Paenibacillus radicis (ex Xue et al. 2023) TaxID=2972489 RepID=A0ABT1YS72_9BACL|nr:Rieske (2Fe-2S) protein [Paenibacillus radicis (ex Xue et al. 2023)]MCR8635143.1 Rieske (2Fe-2S) protein [Paenibacillus radicis (ex Xue et al. 2023)]
MGRHVVGTVTEVQAGGRKIVQAEGRSIGVFNVNGTYYAMRNSCPHQGAPLCQGRVTGMTLTAPPGQYVYGRSGEIIRCPWHGWEFDILTGKSIYDPHKCLVRTYDVTVEQPAAAVAAVVCEPTIEAEETKIETYPITVEDGLIILHI